MSNSVIENIAHGLKITYWNINGLLRKDEDYCKLKDPLFIDQVDKYDIIGLSEIHCGSEEILEYTGYLSELSTRPKLAKARKFSGGLLILIKSQISKGIKRIKSNPGNYIWLRLDKHFFNLQKHIYLCMAYVSPENSTYTRNNNEDYLSLIQNDIIKFQDEGDIMLIGDLNARTSIISDVINNDNEQYLPMNESYIQDCEIPMRNNQDFTINTRGSSLIDLCISAQLRILNGRTLGDLSGQFTCHKHNGSSVVDYCIVNETFRELISYFKVSDHLSDLSDHCRLSCMIKRIKYKVNPTLIEKVMLTPVPTVYKWDNERFAHELSSDKTIKEFKIYMSNHNEDVDNNVKILNNIICSVANRSLMKKRKGERKRKGITRNWYNNDLTKLRLILISKGRKLSEHPNISEHRHNYFSTLKQYRKKCKSTSRQFKCETLHKLENLNEKNPKEYWKLVEKLKNTTGKSATEIDPTIWYSHFKVLNENKQIDLTQEQKDILTGLVDLEKIPIFNKLDNIITEEEIMHGIKSLKCNKSAGPDSITNEMLKCGKQLFVKPLQRLFNSVLSGGCYPKLWAEGYVVPLHKKGTTNDPNNFRGITISSSLGKLFNSILNSRLTTFLNENNIIDEHQIGFREKCRTTDHMFILKCIMDLYKKKKKKLFICFVDFSKAFDKVWHEGLFFKLAKYGISTKFYNIIKNMYHKVSLQVKIGALLTPRFKSDQGVRQGDNLSPSLFNIFINDIPDCLRGCSPAIYFDIPIQCLLYADDLVIFSENEKGMQLALNKLSHYSNTWRLEINISKTKIMCINQSVRSNKSMFNYNKLKLEQVTEYSYLGIIFTEKATFKTALNSLYNKGLKAYFKLLKLLQPLPSAKTALHLFDHLIKPIILYGCEIWGPCKINTPIEAREYDHWKMIRTKFPLEHNMANTNNLYEKLHLKMCRSILGVNKKNSNVGIYGELGRYPLYVDIVKQCQRYIHHLDNNTQNTLLQKVYNSYTESNNSSQNSPNITNFSNTVSKLCDDDANITMGVGTKTKATTLKLQQRYREYWGLHVKTTESRSGIGSNKLRTYSLFKNTFQREPYINLSCTRHFRSNLAKFRLSAHKLKIETGRYNSKNSYVPPSQRICCNCDMGRVEDEEHFLTECPKYNVEREYLFNEANQDCANFSKLSNHNKFIWIMSNESEKLLKALGIFLSKSMKMQSG
jgi:hypothetical protein